MGVAVRDAVGASQSDGHRPWTESTAREGFDTDTDSEGPGAALARFDRPPSFNVLYDVFKGVTGELGKVSGTGTGPGVPVTNPATIPVRTTYADGIPVVKPIRRGRAGAGIGSVGGVLVVPIIRSTFISDLFIRRRNGAVSGTPGGRVTGAAGGGGGVVLGVTFISESFDTLTPGVPMVDGPVAEWVAVVRDPCIVTSHVTFLQSFIHLEGGLAIVKVVNRARNIDGTVGPPEGPTGGVGGRSISITRAIISPGTFG